MPGPPEPLIDACQNGNCVLYVGAGVSAPAQFPVWKTLVEDMMSWAGSEMSMSPSLLQAVEGAVQAGEFTLAADSIVSELQSGDELEHLHAYLQHIFDRPADLTPLHQLFRELPLSAVITTNFDRMLEQTFPEAGDRVLTPHDTERLLELSAKREFFIAKLYGSLDRPETLLVSPAQYEDAIVGNRQFAEFMESIFVSRTLLFLGSSLEGISAYLEGIRFRGGEQQHYALVAVSGSAWKAKAAMLQRRYGIQVLAYPENDAHPEVYAFFNRLVNEVKRRERASSRTTATLKRVVLENIGPFEHLELELTNTWNVLLGDNGVGKSTILKAIALAMCGRDAKPYANRLLRSGTRHGRITLETNQGRSYATDIFMSSRGIEVESRPVGIMEIEGWLALGFPPIRAMSWRGSFGPQGEPALQRPTTNDLLPMMSDEPDPRLDEVKQWIINLDYMKRTADDDSQHDRAFYSRLQDQFFDMIRTLTGELEVEFAGVQPEMWQVMVRTDDGLVPIESVSQGTAALIGWTGLLLKRLYAVVGDMENPMQAYAIVLIDEIDAHMHPRWQQSLLHDLSKLFPNVQFMATTHSPLVVSGMQADQVFRFERDAEGRVERIEVPQDMLFGRADQILTGRGFDLLSTSDYETQKLIQEYKELVRQSHRKPAADDKAAQPLEHRIATLEAQLRQRLPTPEEEPVKRRAIELIDALLDETLSADLPEAKDMLRDRAQKLFDELERQPERWR
ncbi:AAA family ATPase [Candidatus Entotheonella palauensis]|uniref:AAA+ ATPase domain-containing protein n=1 Tax=Candidatus Entotheonella gemina TaxID=1429439 RepID=W4MBC4_9BACT|nr:AAA family ATPase [Candidatus Entotheonella palauensis]ETX07485.1 MAG: hypothetical protein ETSY2_10950 [Candidatus Entotheonella gemina]